MSRLHRGGLAVATWLILAVGSMAGRHALGAQEADADSRAQRCKALAKLSLPKTTINLAQEVTGGTFEPPLASGTPISRLPPFCRVAGTIAPRINFEVWLPAANWNGKFFGIGQGGMAGKLIYSTGSDSLPGMADVLRRGYATATTDTGHAEPPDRYSGSWILSYPKMREDFGYRAVHEMTVQAKAIVQAYYGTAARHSYYAGCSGGGRQGLVEAERYPEDYDGIMAMASANPIELMVWLQNIATAAHARPSNKLSSAQLPAIRRAVLEACDANDGVRDGLIEDPRRCNFSIDQMQCLGNATSECLTRDQLATLQFLYRPLKDDAGNVLFAALPPGHDYSGPLMPALVAGPRPWPLSDEFFRYWIYEDPNWQSRTFREREALKLLQQKATPFLTATPNLHAYHKRGGRLLLVHGWSDEGIPPQVTIDYYHKVIAAIFGEPSALARVRRAEDFVRLFMVPGMNHCRGGPGPTDFDTITALDKWVSEGIGPQRIVASHFSAASGVVDRTRPLCLYPRTAVYKGNGSIDEESNFSCDVLPPYGGQQQNE